MPFYVRLGDVPRKRHIQHRENGTLLTEEVMGLEGFSGNESILYHLTSPCRVEVPQPRRLERARRRGRAAAVPAAVLSRADERRAAR